MTRISREVLLALAVLATVICSALDVPSGGLSVWLFVALSLVTALVLLPFKLLGFLFKGVAALLLLPLMLVLGLVGFLLFGAGILVLLLPALPLVLLALGIWWLAKRRAQPAARPL